MPKYDYNCRNCNSVFEEVRSMFQLQLPAICPMCGAETTERRPSATFFLRSRIIQAVPTSVNAENRGPGLTMVDCSAENNGEAGFAFRGSSRALLQSPRSKGNPIAFDIDDDADVVIRDPIIE